MENKKIIFKNWFSCFAGFPNFILKTFFVFFRTLLDKKNQHFRSIFWDFAEFHMLLYNWPGSEISANITNTSFRVEGMFKINVPWNFDTKYFSHGKQKKSWFWDFFVAIFFLWNCFWKCWRKKIMGQMFNLFQYFQISRFSKMSIFFSGKCWRK